MKGLFIFGIVLISIGAVAQQISPEKWTYSVKKTAPGVYELHCKVTIELPWHIYSQWTPEGGPRPTEFSFNKNPMIAFIGKIKENGKLKQRHEEVFKVDVKYFDGKVDFVQVVKVKSGIKTNATGTVSYMICNDEMCLPPQTKSFSILIQ